MCGIFGLITHSSKESIDKNKVEQSAKLMHHRGPDAYGQWGIENRIHLAHLRLSILDLRKESNQPFFSNCQNFVIVFNGEIYNYLEIRTELELIGYIFRTNSDTEVLLNSFIEWGSVCVNKFNGDWAFAIYNIKENTLFCSRDRFGVKPFNYSIVDNQLVFSSEIKSILNYFPQLRTPNYNVIANYCRNSLGAQIEETWFSGIYRLLPAHNLIWANGEITITRYWDYPKKTQQNINFKDATDRYKELFIDAVKLRMRSDVAVGSTLSSGVDSGSIVSVLRNFYDEEHKTFTAVFNTNEYSSLDKTIFANDIAIDEGSLVKKLAHELNLDSHLINSNSKYFCKDLYEVIYFLESGHSSPATIPLSKIMGFAKNHVKVVLEGQGADELLSGYVLNTFPALLWEYLKRMNINKIIKEFIVFKKSYSLIYAIKQFTRLMNNDAIERFFYILNGSSKVFGPKLKSYKRIKDYPFEPSGFNEYFNEELFKSHTGGLVNLLHYGDAISMSKSIESRLPFMDVNLVEFSFQLPFWFKMNNGLGKYIHRYSMKGIVPSFILDNPIKFGFNTPLSQQFENLETEANKILLSDKCLNRGVFERNGLKSMIDRNISKSSNSSTMLFRLLSVELWFRHFIDISEN